MNYKEYKKELQELVQKEIGDQAKVVITTQVKSNDVIKEGITFEEAGTHAVPVIYLEEIYNTYQESQAIEESVETVLDIFRNSSPFQREDFALSWDLIKPKIQIRLLKREWNKEYINSLIYREWLDFAVIPVVRVSEKEVGSAVASISKSMLAALQIDEKELWNAAFENLQKEYFFVQDIRSIFIGETRQSQEDTGVFVATNWNFQYGARVILRKDILKDFAEKNGYNLFILPSSQNEILILGDNGEMQVEDLKEMVASINGDPKLISKEEVLSNSIYYYDYEQDKVRIAA
ncbi:DUF5688 family protein [Blautia obeum]|uniref:DUF5688 family protein n=1 Tax=Blautia obeum TaxID=40520 RepID=UPI002A8EAF55|nr:DUF5688 family protein [Lachnospiraceae bacterium]